MTFQQLQYLLEVHQTGSITKAAENLFISRPAISLCISNLEAELGYPLFIRTQSGLIPTPQGQLVIKYANSICDAQKRIQNLAEETVEMVKLSVIRYEPVNKALVQLLDEYKNQKDITFSLIANTGIPVKDVALSRVDLALSAKIDRGIDNVGKKVEHWGLQKIELGRIPIAISIGPGHKLYNKENLSVNDFKNDTLLDTANRAWSTSGLIREVVGLAPDKVISYSHNPALKYSILAEGLAYTITRYPPSADIANHSLRCVPVPNAFNRLVAIYDPKRPLPEAAESFLHILKEKLQSDPYFIEAK